MVGHNPLFTALAFSVLVVAACALLAPLYLAMTTASLSLPAIAERGVSPWIGPHLLENIVQAWTQAHLGRLLINSVIVSLLVVGGKLVLASLSAFAIVYFKVWYRHLLFWTVLATIMLPLEVRIVPTYAIASNIAAPLQAILDITGLSRLVAAVLGVRVSLVLNLLDTYAGLSLPLIATATGTFLFRQFFLTVPPELAEAARLDGAGPLRFYIDVLVPLARPHMAALATILFIGSWNTYLWPMIVTTDPAMRTVVTGVVAFRPIAIDGAVPEWNLMMAASLVVVFPPLVVIVIMQRYVGYGSGPTPRRRDLLK